MGAFRRLALLGVAAVVLLSAVAVSAAGASNAKAPISPSAADKCAPAKALEGAGEEAEARKAYIKLLEGPSPPACATEGLDHLNGPKAEAVDCKRGQIYETVSRDGDAVKAYEKALEVDPESECAKAGLEGLSPGDLTGSVTSISSDVTDWLGAIAVAVGLVALGVILFLATVGRIPLVTRRLFGVPLLGGLIAPRLSIESVSDDATGQKPGVPIAATIKECMQQLREKAAAGPSSDYDLDWPGPGEEFADLASATTGLQEALGKASDISDQAKVVAALLSLVYLALPSIRVTLTGAVAPTHDGVSIALGLEKNGSLQASTTIRAKPKEADAAVPDYVELAKPAAVWTQFGVGRILAGKQITSDSADSAGLLRQGLDSRSPVEDRSVARGYLQKAIRLDEENWAAYVSLASIPVSETEDEDGGVHKMVTEYLWSGLGRLAGEPDA
jgi:tetratricopeptide (TPR) repeat protein